MSGTTADKLNYLKDTKELLRQEINNNFIDVNLTVSEPFRQYPSRMGSSQLWIDAWIGGSYKYSINYDGASVPELFYHRYFDTLSLPNVTSIKSLFADTVTFGGPSGNISYISISGCDIKNLYITNPTKIDIYDSTGMNPAALHGGNRIYLPNVTYIGGKPVAWVGGAFAVIGIGALYLPKTSRLDDYALSGIGDLHIGTGLGKNICNMLSNKSIQDITTIYVPASLVNGYKSATNWSSFADRIYAEPGT